MSNRVFRIDPDSKNVVEIKPTTFSREGFLETKDIHEWLVSHPGILGDDLLIVQREHLGVVGSHRRPDILAVDQKGNLVIVEVKRDDSPTYVYWQAALYAASYWPRSGEDIVEMFSSYATIDGEEALDRLITHTDSEDEPDLLSKLNSKQRIILVAGSFPREVTTTVLWLNEQGLDVSCLQLTPYPDRASKTFYIQSSYIIPVPETGDLMVELRKTEKEREEQKSGIASRQNDRVTQFMFLVSSQLANMLEPDLMPPNMSRWAGTGGAVRYFDYWYAPVVKERGYWYSIWSGDLNEISENTPLPDSIKLSICFNGKPSKLKEISVSEATIEGLQMLAKELNGKGRFAYKERKGNFLVEKTLTINDLSVDSAREIAKSLAWLIQNIQPQIYAILGE